MKLSFIPFLVILALTCVLPGIGKDINLSARIDKNPVNMNEQFSYEVEVSGSIQNLPDIKLPEFSDFAILGGPNVSTSFQIVNFNMKASKIYSLILMPRKTGTFKIGPATAKFKGKSYQSNTIDITVKKQHSPQTGRQKKSTGKQSKKSQPDIDLSDVVMLRAIPSKRSAYINEEVTIRYKIYFRTQITNNEIAKLPEAVGCWVEEYPVPQRPKVYTEVIKGVQYNVAEIKKMALFPSRAGKISISPLELIIETVVRSRKPRDSFDLFDDFFNNPFGRTVKKRLSSGSVNINVLNLPAVGKPDNFSGLVGDFKLHSAIDKQTCATDEAVSYKVKISGNGLLKFINQLPVEFSPNFEVYEPKISESINKNSAKLTSNKEFEYVVIPRVSGEHYIKPAKLAYFNPTDKSYHYLKIPEYKLQVLQGTKMAAELSGGVGLSKEEVKLLAQDINFIKEKASGFKAIGSMPYQKWWFYIFLAFPVILFGIAVAYRNHIDKMSSNVQYARSRKAHRQARNRLKEAKDFLKHDKVKEYYGSVSNALIGYVADKTNSSSAGLVREQAEDLLEKSKVEKDLQKDYFKCLDEADYRRFAPGQSGKLELQDFYDRAEKILINLEKYF